MPCFSNAGYIIQVYAAATLLYIIHNFFIYKDFALRGA